MFDMKEYGVNPTNINQTTSDGIRPNALGTEYIANYLEHKLIELYISNPK